MSPSRVWDSIRLVGLLPLLIPGGALDRCAALSDPSEHATRDAEPLERLRAGAIADRRSPPATFYAWISEAELHEIRKHPDQLLNDVMDDRAQWSIFAATVHQQANYDVMTNTLLSEGRLSKERLAWHHPWGMMTGWVGPSYGDQLIEVRLKPEAWVGTFNIRAEDVWTFTDMNGRVVPNGQVQQHPERIAAVFHENTPTKGPTWVRVAFEQASPVFREFILVNQNMIASWSHSTTTIQKRLHEDAEMLESLAQYTAMAPQTNTRWRELVEARWLETGSVPSDAPTWLDPYIENLALSDAQYQASPRLLRRLAALLRERAASIQGPPTRWNHDQ
ncbi:MAG: hypothetical protein AAFV53_39430 [Myxococcota bacterium]